MNRNKTKQGKCCNQRKVYPNNKKKSFQGLGPRLGPGPELDNLSCSEYWKLGVPRAPGKFIENCGSFGQDWLLCLLNIPFFSIWDEKVSNIRKLNKTREMMRKHSKSGSNIHWLWGFMRHYSSRENIFRRKLLENCLCLTKMNGWWSIEVNSGKKRTHLGLKRLIVRRRRVLCGSQ